MKIKISLPAIITIFYFSASAFASGAGTTAANFLKLGIGARAAGMGESFTAVADDVNALYWNPAGIGLMKNSELTATHNVWFQDINYEYVGFAMPVLGSKRRLTDSVYGRPYLGSVGISATYLYIRDIERRSSNTPEPEGYFGADDLSISVSYAQPVYRFGKNKVVSAGLNLKSITQTIDSKKANAYAADFGVLSRLNKLSLGFVVQNIGTDIKFMEESYPLPLTYRCGVCYAMIDNSLNVSMDISKPRDGKINFNIGTEYWVGSLFALRAGYLRKDSMTRDALSGRSLGNSANQSLARLTGFMAGTGFRLLNYGLDYAFVPYGELGSTHRFTLSMKY